MEMYTTGINIDDETALLVTIELLDETDVSGMILERGKYKSLFYKPFSVNCGKVKTISSLDGKKTYDSCILSVGELGYNVSSGNYFNIKNGGLQCYTYKACVVENIINVTDKDFTGAIIKHFPTGNVFKKVRYKNGILMAEQIFRDDTYNTLAAVCRYQNGDLQVIWVYDNNENRIGETYYDSEREIFKKSGSDVDEEILELLEINDDIIYQKHLMC